MVSYSQTMATVQKLAHRQIMTTSMIQSIRLMAMPLTELRETIQEELEKNPALELEREAAAAERYSVSEAEIKKNQLNESDPFANSSDPGYQPRQQKDADSNQRFIEGTISRAESLHDHLLSQLSLLTLDTTLRELTEKVIWNLDGNGFHLEAPELLIPPDHNYLLPQILGIIQGFDPVGCGCMNWRESLIVQAAIRGDAPEDFERFVNEALTLMEKKRHEDVRTTLKISKDDWEFLETYTSILNPFPGRQYATEQVQYIIPDLQVKKDDDEHTLVLNDEVLPVLRVDAEFEKLCSGDMENKETKQFITSHLRDARQFINSLTQRENTLLKAAKAIIEFQRDFFAGGPRFLRPLTLNDIAGEIGVHEATVSRITMNKYIQTEWGLFPLKYFFSNSISGAGSSGSGVSKVAAKEVIREILTANNGKKRISDNKMSELLARRGIHIARRTVAKYRKELDIPAVYSR